MLVVPPLEASAMCTCQLCITHTMHHPLQQQLVGSHLLQVDCTLAQVVTGFFPMSHLLKLDCPQGKHAHPTRTHTRGVVVQPLARNMPPASYHPQLQLSTSSGPPQLQLSSTQLSGGAWRWKALYISSCCSCCSPPGGTLGGTCCSAARK